MSADALLTLDKVAKRLAVSIRTVRRADVYPPPGRKAPGRHEGSAMTGTAWISECGRYRYSLTRRFADGLDLVFVMLNPSTADADKDDPTIRRCCGFADRMGFGGIIVVNLFALRAAAPEVTR